MKGEHVKDAAIAAFQKKNGMLRRAATRTRAPPTPAFRWHMKDEHVNDTAQGVAEDAPQEVAQDLAFGARVARALLATPPRPPPPSLCSSRRDGGATGQLSGIWLGLWASVSGGAAQSASMFISR